MFHRADTLKELRENISLFENCKLTAVYGSQYQQTEVIYYYLLSQTKIQLKANLKLHMKNFCVYF